MLSGSLRPRTRALLLGLSALFVATQLAATLGWYRQWPFAPYDMFAWRGSPIAQVWVVELVASDGTIREADPGNVVPLEFFRARALVRELVDPRSGIDRDALVDKLLERLNRRGWIAFDETWPAIRPEGAVRFVDARFGLRTVRLSVTEGGTTTEIVRDRILYAGLTP